MNRIYYVTLQRGLTTKIIAGPFATHEDAAAQVEPARAVATTSDPRSHFDAFGVTSAVPREGDNPPVGRFNRILCETPAEAA